MIVHQIPTDKMLENLRDAYMRNISTPPADAETSMTHMESIIGHDAYMEIEDDISRIMDSYELRGFQLGFRLSLKTLIDLLSPDFQI